MSEIDYELPGLPGWDFQSTGPYGTYLYSPGGTGFKFTAPIIAAEIGANVKRIVLKNLAATEELAEAAAQDAMNIDWEKMLKRGNVFSAPLINAVPEDRTALADKICALIKQLA